MQPGQMHEFVKPLKWLIGTWKSVNARVSYPTMKCPVEYEECLSFISLGQPLLNYNSLTWNAKDKSPMHLEAGFIRIGEKGCDASLLSSMNLGISTVEECTVGENTLMTDSKVIGSGIYAKFQVTAVQRCYSLNEKGQLVYKAKLQTPNTPLTPHLEALYDKERDK